MKLKAVALNTDTTLEQKMHTAGCDMDWQAANSVEQLNSKVASGDFDVVVLPEMPDLSGAELLDQLRKKKPDIPAVLLVAPASGMWQQGMTDSRTVLVSSLASPLEIQHRIAKLINQVRTAAQAIPTGASLTRTVRELRNERSGKLDARLIADAFGMSLADVARGVNKKLQTVQKTPDSDSLQKLLYPYERIASAIKYTTGSLQPSLKIWLNAYTPTTPNSMPIELIKAGNAEAMADVWDDVLMGHPD